MEPESYFTAYNRLYNSIKAGGIESSHHQHYQPYKQSIIPIPPKLNMESQTQTITVPPISNAVSSGSETAPDVDVNGGHSSAKEELPEPKPKPQEVKEPEDAESLEDRMATDDEINENKRQWEAYNASEWAHYVALKEEVESINPDGFAKAEDDEEGGKGSRNILAGMSFQNGHQVNELLLDQLRIVLETDADRTKRDEGYKCRCFLDLVI